MEKRRITNLVSTVLLVVGGVFALQVLISNVSAITNRLDHGTEAGDYFYGILNNTADEEFDALVVDDLCIYSSNGYFEMKDKTIRVDCNGKVPGVSFDKATNTLLLDNYKEGKEIRYFDSRKTEKDNLNIKVSGDNRVGAIYVGNYLTWDDEKMEINIDGGREGFLEIDYFMSFYNLNREYSFYSDDRVKVNFKDIEIDASQIIGHVGCADEEEGDCEMGNSFRPHIYAKDLSLENVIYNGSLDNATRRLSLKNSVIEPIYDDIYQFDDESNSDIEIENTIFTKPMNALRNVFGELNIRNSSIELKETELNDLDYFTLMSASDSIASCVPEDRLTITEDHVVGTCRNSGNGVEENIDYLATDLINLENVNVGDNLHIKTVLIEHHPTDASDYSYRSESVLATDETSFNAETRKWENYPKHIVLTAKDSTRLGVDFEARDKSKIDWGSEDVGDVGDGADEEGENLRQVTDKDILEGANQEMSLNEVKDLVVRYDRDIDLFEKVLFDGKELSEKDYTLKAGSTILTIKADYLKTQKAGEHKISAYFEGDNGPIETTITLKASKAENNKNVGTSNTGLFTVEKGDYSETSKTIFTVLAFGLIISGAILKIRNRNKKAIYRLR